VASARKITRIRVTRHFPQEIYSYYSFTRITRLLVSLDYSITRIARLLVLLVYSYYSFTRIARLLVLLVHSCYSHCSYRLFVFPWRLTHFLVFLLSTLSMTRCLYIAGVLLIVIAIMIYESPFDLPSIPKLPSVLDSSGSSS
jgi:hypothetical protein